MPQNQDYSREHLNQLLQQGLEIPIDEEKLTPDYSSGTFPEMPICTVCLISVGETPVQAAQHYRSREHVNKRLQKGLPVATGSAAAAPDKDDAGQRDYINECLRLGVPNPYGLQSDSVTAPVLPKPSNGKRKFPVQSIGNNAPPGTLAGPMSGYGHGKRPCRPTLQNNVSDFQSNNSLSMGFQGNPSRPQSAQLLRPPFQRTRAPVARATRPVAPSSNQWSMSVNAQPREPFYKDQFFGTGVGDTYTANSTFANQYQDQSSALYAAQQTAPIYDEHQGGAMFNASQNAIYNEDTGSSFSEGWFCDLCNQALPTAAALNQHTSSAEHRLAAGWTTPQSHVPSLFQNW